MGFDPGTGALKYGTFLGGAKSSLGNSLQLDSTGAIYVAGGTESAFPSSIGTPTHTYPPAGGATAAGTDMFLMKLLRSAQNALTVSYLTIIQGDADDGIAATTIDGAGDQFFIGSTASQHLPVTAGVYRYLQKRERNRLPMGEGAQADASECLRKRCRRRSRSFGGSQFSHLPRRYRTRLG